MMIRFNDTGLEKLSIHFVGNRTQEEDLRLSENQQELDDDIRGVLKDYFTKPFKEADLHKFKHEVSLEMNEVCNLATKIFQQPATFHEHSKNLATHLYQIAEHPNIKGGEFYLVYLSDCYIGDEMADAIGIFKSETKDTFLKVYPKSDGFGIEKEEGISINKMDKGCLIFDLDSEDGYHIAIVDKTNKNNEAVYWKNTYLQVEPRANSHYYTTNYLQMCKDFVLDTFQEADRVDQVALMNESKNFFDKNEEFNKIEFEQKVLQEPEIIEKFDSYKEEYKRDREVEIVDEFNIERAAVKKMNRVYKSVIKLDKNFHIYIHGNRDYIKRGEDPVSGMKFYQLLFDQET